MKRKSIDLNKFNEYLVSNSDRSIQEVYDEIKSKSRKDRSNEESLLFTYLSLNKKKLGIRS